MNRFAFQFKWSVILSIATLTIMGWGSSNEAAPTQGSGSVDVQPDLSVAEKPARPRAETKLPDPD